MSESKTHQIFRSRIEFLEQHLEATDAAARIAYNILGYKSNRDKTISEALPIDCSNYSRLSHPSNARGRIYNYSKSKIVQAIIIELYGYFTEYLREILKEIYVHNPMLVVNKSPNPLSMRYSDLAVIPSINDLHSKMVDNVFRSLENERSTTKLIDKVIKGTDVSISNSDKDPVLPYCEMRHLLIHNNGKVDDAFESKYGGTFSVKKGAKLPSNFKIANDAIKALSSFVAKLDREFIRLNLVVQFDL